MLQKVLQSKNIKNGLWLYLLQIFNTIIPLITLPYITRVLGRGKYGTFSIALNVIGYLQVLIEYGFGMSATREVAVSSKRKEDLCPIFTGVFFARLILMSFGVIIAIAYLVISGASIILCKCLVIMLICLLGYCFQQNWLFQGMQEMKYVSIISIVSRSVSTALIFMLVKNESQLTLYCFLYTFSPLLSGLIGFLIAKKKYGIQFVKINLELIKQKLEKGWYVFTTQLSSKVFGAIGITFLGILSTDVEVGTFSAIQKIPQIMMLAWSPISQVIYPIVSQKMRNSFDEGYSYVKKLRKLFLTLFIIPALIIGAFAKPIVRIAFGSGYEDNYYWIYPLLGWTVVSIFNNFMGIQTLLSSNHDKEYSICFQISVVFTIILNFVLIYIWGGNGASIAPILAEAILSITLIYQVNKLKINCSIN